VTLPEENRTFSGGDGTHLPTIIKSPEARGWTFFGWDIMKHKMKQKSYRNKVLQRSAAVLGYAAHVSFSYEVFLLCSITNIPTYATFGTGNFHTNKFFFTGNMLETEKNPLIKWGI
jgi:hypothetical protein